MIKLQYGHTNTYFMNGLLIDTDMPDTLPALFRALKQNGLTVQDIHYVLATHYHPDHMGLISRLMRLGVRLILLEKQKAYVHASDVIFARQPHLGYEPIDETKAMLLRCEESRSFLRGLGLSGEIVPTESHSPDGVALVTDDGYCFVGDLEPIPFIEAYGEDSLLKRDWDRIRAYQPTMAYFGHINDQKIGYS